MLSSDLLVSLCETDAEEWKFVIRNQNGSLNREMFGFHYLGGHSLTHGTPKENAVYLIVDVLLINADPDLIYSFKGEEIESTFFGYLVDDAPAYVTT